MPFTKKVLDRILIHSSTSPNYDENNVDYHIKSNDR